MSDGIGGTVRESPPPWPAADRLGIDPPAAINGVAQMPLEGVSFAPSLLDPAAPERDRPQYFEMFGHRGLWYRGWKAVAFHPSGTPFDADTWELFDLTADFAETRSLAAAERGRLRELIALWWAEAEAHQVLPLDDHFGPRFAENAARFHGPRTRFVFHAGMGHVPTDVAPDVRSRSYAIEADVAIPAGAEGVLIAHGDATCGYSLYVQGGHLVHDMNVGGAHVIARSDRPVPPGRHRLGIRLHRDGGRRTATLLIDGAPAGSVTTPLGFVSFISWSGLDIGRDRGSPVSHYPAPFAFTGTLRRVTVTMDGDQTLDGEGVGRAEMARQ